MLKYSSNMLLYVNSCPYAATVRFPKVLVRLPWLLSKIVGLNHSVGELVGTIDFDRAMCAGSSV